MLKCGTLSKKETEEVNERSVTQDYTPEDGAKIGRRAAENGPARATRHFVVPETTGKRLKSE